MITFVPVIITTEMSEKSFKMPVVAWLRVTDYMHGWIQKELAGGARIGGKKVVCVQHLGGGRDALRMETADDVTGDNEDMKPAVQENSLSATRWSCIDAGLTLDQKAVEQHYGMTRQELSLFVPVECPGTCLTPLGVLRPWTADRCFGRQQSTALQRVLREAFWRGIAEYDREYARRMEGEKYAVIDMIEAFCRDTGTSDLHADAMRREWMRQRKRF